MSENLRLATIVAVFVVMGAILWTVLSGDPDAPVVTSVSGVPEIEIKSAEVPEFDFDDSSSRGGIDSTQSTSTETRTSTRGETARRSTNSSADAKPDGQALIKGTINMIDGESIPSDLVVVLHYVPDDARYDGSVDTVLATSEVDSDGAFTFDELPFGSFVLFGMSESHTGTTNRTLTAERPESESTLALYPAATISGRVLNGQGEAVLDANVFVAGYLSGGSDLKADIYRSRASGVSVDEEGGYRMTSLQIREPALQYRLLASAPGYAPTITELHPTGAAGVDIILNGGASVAGQVINLTTNEAVAGVSLRASSPYAMSTMETTTDDQGSFIFAGLSAGTQHFEVLDDNLVVSSDSISVELASDQLIDDLEIRVAVGAMVAGRVYDEETDAGVGAVTISARPENIPTASSKEVTTDSAGYYLLQGLNEGNYRIEYSEMEHYPSDSRWDDRKQVVTTLGQRLANVDFPVSKGLSISGIVVDSDGKPVDQARIYGSVNNGNTRDSKRTKTSGTFTLYGYAAQSTVSLNVTASGKGRQYENVVIENESVTGLRFTLDAEGTISGTVVDGRGNPVRNVDISSRGKEGNTFYDSDTVDAQGRFELDGLSAGTYNLKPSFNNRFSSGDPTLAEVDLSAGENVTGLRLVMKEFGGALSITGRITDDRGEPVSGINIHTWSSGGYNSNTSSGADGVYTLNNLEPGAYQISASSQTHAPQHLRGIEAGSNSADMVMPRGGSVSGSVYDAVSGEAVTDFSLLLVNGTYQPHMANQFKRYHHDEGEFLISGGYPNQTVSLMVRSPGYAETSVPIDGIQSGESLDNVRISLAHGNELSGVVVDSAGNRLSGVSIYKGPVPGYQQGEYALAQTDGNGEFVLAGLPHGEVIVSAFLKGLATSEAVVTIGTGQNTVQLVLHEGGRVEGLVTLDGKPMPNSSVHGNIFSGTSGSSTINIRGQTDSEGWYSIGGLSDGRGNVSANIQVDGEHRNLSVQIESAAGMTTEVNFPFESASSSVEGYLMSSETETMSGQVSLIVTTENGSNESRFQDVASDGYYKFTGLPEGQVALRSYGGSIGRQKVANVPLGKNENIRLDIKLYGGAIVNCYVNNAPSDHVTFVALVTGGTHFPDEPDMSFFQNIAGAMVSQAQVQAGVGIMEGVTGGTYELLAIAYGMTTGEPDFSKMKITTQTVEIPDEGTVELRVDF